MTTFTTEDRESAENPKKKPLEVPEDWEDTSAPWPFSEDDALYTEELPDFKEE